MELASCQNSAAYLSRWHGIYLLLPTLLRCPGWDLPHRPGRICIISLLLFTPYSTLPSRLGLFIALAGRRAQPGQLPHHGSGARRSERNVVPGELFGMDLVWACLQCNHRGLPIVAAAGKAMDWGLAVGKHPEANLCLLSGARQPPQMECNIAGFAEQLGETAVAAAFRQHAAARLAAIDALLWDGSSGQWRDLIMGEPEAQGQPGSKPASASAAVEGSPPASAARAAGSASGAAASELQQAAAGEQAASAGAAPAVCSSYRHSGVVAASNWLPLYCGCAQAGSSQAAAAVASLRSSGLLQAAGVAVTLRETGQQWDWPNAWPPITAMLIEGCAAAGGPEGQQVGPVHSCGCGLMRAGSLPSACAAAVAARCPSGWLRLRCPWHLHALRPIYTCASPPTLSAHSWRPSWHNST